MSNHFNAMLDNIYNKEIERGDIFWANIPYDPQNPRTIYGMRPVLVVSNDMCNKHSPLIIILPLTTHSDKYYYIHPSIAGLDGRTSYALTEQPKVFEKDRLGAFIRHASPSEMIKLDEALLLSLGMISYLERISELENELTVLRNKVPEVKIEKEIIEVPRQIDEDALNIGTHVKSILEIMMKSYNLQPNVSSQNTYSKDSGVSDINVDKDLENTDFSINSTATATKIIATADSTTSNELHKDKNKKKADNKPLSQIDKFNKRYQTYLNNHSHSYEPKSPRSNPKGHTNHREEYDLSDVKQRPNAHKWTQERIKEFILDCQSKKMTDEEIGNKYGIAQHTVKGYFYKLKSKIW